MFGLQRGVGCVLIRIHLSKKQTNVNNISYLYIISILPAFLLGRRLLVSWALQRRHLHWKVDPTYHANHTPLLQFLQQKKQPLVRLCDLLFTHSSKHGRRQVHTFAWRSSVSHTILYDTLLRRLPSTWQRSILISSSLRSHTLGVWLVACALAS